MLSPRLGPTFVHSFATWMRGVERGHVDHFITAFVLNTILVVKIFGLVGGVAIVVIGLILSGPVRRSSEGMSVILPFLAIIVAIDFILTGNSHDRAAKA